MKKLLTLALVFVMVLSFAAPAMAYTTRQGVAAGASPYTVDIYLVEHTTGDALAMNWLSLPPSDRGYAKNEIVAAIGTLTIPANYNVHQDGYRGLYFKGQNVNLNVTDNIRNIGGGNGFYLLSANTANAIGSAPAYNFYGQVPGTAAFPWTLYADDTGLRHWIADPGAPRVGPPVVATTLDMVGAGAVAGDSALPLLSTTRTVKFLCFGKVTADDAKMTFGLSRRASWVDNTNAVTAGTMVGNGHWGINPFTANDWLDTDLFTASPYLNNLSTTLSTLISAGARLDSILVLSEDLIAARLNNNAIGPNVYFVFENPDGYSFPSNAANAGGRIAGTGSPVQGDPGDLMFIIQTASRGVSERLYMFPNGTTGIGYHVFVEPSTNELVFVVTDLGRGNLGTRRVGDDIRFGSVGYSSLLGFYNEWFEGKLGFTAYNRGNILIGSDWTDLAAAAFDVKETVDIEPWTPYVSVPDNIVTDPPKTGDASILGFVMIALAGAAAVVVKKVHA